MVVEALRGRAVGDEPEVVHQVEGIGVVNGVSIV
jgi:hypothetical protein